MNRDTLLCILIGAASGTLSGLLGVGGAIVLVPMLVGLLSLSQHKAHGTSLAAVAVTAVAGGIQYARLGYVDIGLAAQLAVGSVVGAVIGARLMARIPARRLRQGFGLLLLAVGLRMILQG